MERVVICRYGEIGIKGGNRVAFERKLAQNITACLAAHGVRVGRISRPYGRIIAATDGAVDSLRTVFGITSFSPAIIADTLDDAKRLAPDALALKPGETFRVTCQRLDKGFPMVSREVGKEIGVAIEAATGNHADLEGFTRELEVEVIDGKLYLCGERIPGPGGLPVGIQGSAAALVRNERDILAALLIMRRGCSIIPIIERKTDIRLLEGYACGLPMKADRALPPDITVLVSGDAEPALPENGILQLRPLAGLTEATIKEKLHAFRTAANLHG